MNGIPFPPRIAQLSAVSTALCVDDPAEPVIYASAYTQLGKLKPLENLVLLKCKKPKRKIDLLMLSIGGNDVGFSRLAANAVLHDESLLKTVGGWMGNIYNAKTASGHLAGLRPRYKALNKALHYVLGIPWPQADRVILTGYPPIASAADGRTFVHRGDTRYDATSRFHNFEREIERGREVRREAKPENGKVGAPIGMALCLCPSRRISRTRILRREK